MNDSGLNQQCQRFRKQCGKPRHKPSSVAAWDVHKERSDRESDTLQNKTKTVTAVHSLR